jgi:NADH:ubiquinone oxidoreductase subunit F (NADH-binding)
MAHREVYGRALEGDQEELGALIERSGLLGRGGGRFPLALKLAASRASALEPVVIVNLSESEPASRKDFALGCGRPHLVLDGAEVVARSVGASMVTLRLHLGSRPLERSLRAAVAERPSVPVRFCLSLGPRRYVAGEGSAVASAVAGGPALPMHTTMSLAIRGPGDRPTVVLNAETAAHVGAIGSIGLEQWSASGLADAPGTRLVTLVGAVRAPGSVVELTAPTTFRSLLEWQGVRATPAAVLVGGYAGAWFEGETVMDLQVSDTELSSFGASLGCGLIGVIPRGRCVLAEVGRLVRYLADESAGQCGPCVHGLAEVASVVELLVDGRARPRHLRRLRALDAEIDGRGACAHPDATLRMVRSAMAMLAKEVDRHLSGRSCLELDRRSVLPIPENQG